ncbi:MAG: nickel-responsive transcriptional regulator NikR [Atopobiaceae bacterium]|nr:nickel-responsive transcriptional regulator NikR [Atopobiaceae bacterium]
MGLGMASDLVRFTVAVPEGLLREFDEHTARRGTHVNRSEAVRDLMREQMAGDDTTDPDTDVVGSITMVYDHHTVGLSGALDEIQHDHMDEIVSTMHVHLDHHSCLEVLAVRGRSGSIRMLSDLLLGTKGVRFGRLACVATSSAIEAGH